MAQTVGKLKSGNVTGLDTVAKRQAKAEASNTNRGSVERGDKLACERFADFFYPCQNLTIMDFFYPSRNLAACADSRCQPDLWAK